MRNLKTFFHKTAFIPSLLSAVLLTAPAFLSAQGGSGIPFLKVYDPDHNGKTWKGEDTGAQMKLWSFEGLGILECQRSERSWGSLYRTVAVDLDRHPFLEINVLSASRRWYLILAGDQFPDGFLRLIETDGTGLFRFNVPEITRLKGLQKLDVKIGISDPAGAALANEKVFFDKFVFIATAAAPAPALASVFSGAKKAPLSGGLNLLDPSGKDLDLWQEFVKGGPHEVRFSVRNGLGIVKGKMNDRNWGAVHRDITADLSQFPVFEINVLDCSRSWYIIVESPGLNDGYYRLIDTQNIGLYEFDLPALTGLSGEQTFQIQIGVSYPESDSVKGEYVVFDRVRLKKR